MLAHRATAARKQKLTANGLKIYSRIIWIIFWLLTWMTTHPIIRQTPTRVMYKFPRTLCIYRIFWQMDPMEIYMAVKKPNRITECCYLRTESQSLSSTQGNMSSIGLKEHIYPL